MATMNIKDPEVRRLALELARVRGISMTEAVRQAVHEALERTPLVKDDAWVERILAMGTEIRAEMDRLGVEPLTDDDLYDERGLPR